MPKNSFSFLENISQQDKLLFVNTLSWAENARDKYVTRFTYFLDERQQKLCKQVLASEKLDNYCFRGGYEGAQRQVMCLLSPCDSAETIEFPIKCVNFSYRKADELSHRDFLGALMSLKIQRYCVGDIVVGQGSTNVFVLDSVAQLVADEVTKIGRVGVRAELFCDDSITVQVRTQEINGTVASLRADSILSLALHISREKASALIKNKGISIDHITTFKTDSLISEHQTFSVMGCGKFVLESINGVSKKDRIHVTLCKFI